MREYRIAFVIACLGGLLLERFFLQNYGWFMSDVGVFSAVVSVMCMLLVQQNSTNVYEQLADALDKLPNGFPRTPSDSEIQILKRIFSPEEASLGSQLGGDMEPFDAIAERAGLPAEDVKRNLIAMAERGLVWRKTQDETPHFRLAPFIVGIYESQLHMMDHEFAHLVENYMADGGAAGIMKFQPALHRVVPAQHAVALEWILPYDDVRAILLAAKAFSVAKRRAISRSESCLGVPLAQEP